MKAWACTDCYFPSTYMMSFVCVSWTLRGVCKSWPSADPGRYQVAHTDTIIEIAIIVITNSNKTNPAIVGNGGFRGVELGSIKLALLFITRYHHQKRGSWGAPAQRIRRPPVSGLAPSLAVAVRRSTHNVSITRLCLRPPSPSRASRIADQ